MQAKTKKWRLGRRKWNTRSRKEMWLQLQLLLSPQLPPKQRFVLHTDPLLGLQFTLDLFLKWSFVPEL